MRQAKAANRMPSTVRHPPTLAPVAVRGFGRLFSAADARNEAGTTAALYGQRQRNRPICFEPEDAADTEQTDNSQWIVLHLGMEEQRLRSRGVSRTARLSSSPIDGEKQQAARQLLKAIPSVV